MLAGNRLKTCFGASFAISSTLVCAVQTGKKNIFAMYFAHVVGPGSQNLTERVWGYVGWPGTATVGARPGRRSKK